jgi:hypothetical protein
MRFELSHADGQTNGQGNRQTGRQTDRYTDVTKLIIALRNFANAPKSKKII